MPRGDSPPPFQVRFRARRPHVREAGVYQQALELTALVHKIVDMEGVARFHLRNLLDRHATSLALALGRAAAEVAPAERRRLYRVTRPTVVEVGTILDMIARRTPIDPEIVEQARTVTGEIAARLEQLSNNSRGEP